MKLTEILWEATRGLGLIGFLALIGAGIGFGIAQVEAAVAHDCESRVYHSRIVEVDTEHLTCAVIERVDPHRVYPIAHSCVIRPAEWPSSIRPPTPTPEPTPEPHGWPSATPTPHGWR
jgi:hypothetical protein